MTPVLTLGPVYVTPFSLMIFAGVLAGVALVWRHQQIRPLLPCVLIGAVLLGHAVWVLFCPPDFDTGEGFFAMFLRFWQGGYTLYGALLGGALGALIGGKLNGVRFVDALDRLAPGACAVILFARVGEVFTGEGIGRWADVEWTHFFPLTTCVYQDEDFQEWRWIVWFWEALAALVILVILLRRERRALRNRPGEQTALFLALLAVTQILLEQARRDYYLRVIVFVRVSQLFALVSLIVVLAVLLTRFRPTKAQAAWSAAALVFGGLADMAAEFVFDKYEYAPWLFAGLPAAVIAGSGLLFAYKKKKAALPAALLCVAAAALLIAYASKPWAELDLEPAEDMFRFALLYGSMIVSLVVMGLPVFLHPYMKLSSPLKEGMKSASAEAASCS